MARSKKLLVSSRAAHLNSAEIRLLDAFKDMHPEDRELLIAYALRRVACFTEEKKSHLTLVHGGLQ